MIEKHGLHNGLDERDEIIVPPYVRQFMGEYGWLTAPLGTPQEAKRTTASWRLRS
jgi:hypothetical protein